MRELKFRAWDKSVEHLYEVQTLIDGGDAIGRYVLNGEMCYIHLCADEIIVEQYTGLKDKNGKEIYDGDIVGFKWRTKRLYVVTYRKYDASFILENDEWEETIHLSLDKDDFEVFGNIHENPELLEVVKDER